MGTRGPKERPPFFDEDQIADMHQRFKDGETLTRIAKAYGTNPQKVHRKIQPLITKEESQEHWKSVLEARRGDGSQVGPSRDDESSIRNPLPRSSPAVADLGVENTDSGTENADSGRFHTPRLDERIVPDFPPFLRKGRPEINLRALYNYLVYDAPERVIWQLAKNNVVTNFGEADGPHDEIFRGLVDAEVIAEHNGSLLVRYAATEIIAEALHHRFDDVNTTDGRARLGKTKKKVDLKKDDEEA